MGTGFKYIVLHLSRNHYVKKVRYTSSNFYYLSISHFLLCTEQWGRGLDF